MEGNRMDRNDQSTADRIMAEQLSAFRPDDDWQPNVLRGLAILRERRAASRARTRRWAFVTAGAAAVCLSIMALPVTRALAARCVSACVRETAMVREVVTGHPVAPVAGTTYLKPADRRTAPDFTVTDASGRRIRLSDLRGKVVLLNFWATWCVPCVQEIPWFVEFQKANEARGFTVLGVSMDDGGRAAVKSYIEAKGVNYPVVIGDDTVARLFGGVPSLPLTLLIDRAGRIAAAHAGLCSRNEYQTDIDFLLNEKGQ